MISIIISSYRQQYFSFLKKNIADTIGVEYEIIKVDNAGKMGICEAYNIGAKKARYPYLCFVHEDVKFISTSWGVNLINHFISDNNCGVIGVAGSIYKVRMLSTWWQPEVAGIEPKRTNYIQYFENTQTRDHMFLNPFAEKRSVVATLDGVFLGVKKDRWKEILFDQNLLKGFHGYDLDFTLRVGLRFNNYVVYDILLEHFSEGTISPDWFKQVYLVHKKNKKHLPVTKSGLIKIKDLRPIEKGYLEKSLDYVSKWQLKKYRIMVVFMHLIYNSKLFRPNRIFLKSLLKEFSNNRKSLELQE